MCMYMCECLYVNKYMYMCECVYENKLSKAKLVYTEIVVKPTKVI